MKRNIALIATAIATILAITGCTGQSSPNARDQRTSRQILGQYENSQPVPQFPWSQIRQTAIDIETAQAKSTQTTTFFFNQGVSDPVQSCPSIGFPVASTTQLTNPSQISGYHNDTAIPQIDPNGIYAGDSTGTYVLCVDANGQTYGVYWEGFVYSVTGPAVFDAKSHDVKMTGPTTFKFKTR